MITTEDNIRFMEGMMRSCFAYGSIEIDSYDFKRYIAYYMDKLGEGIFWEVYNRQKKNLEENFTVKHNTYTDCEGVTYNTLVEKS